MLDERMEIIEKREKLLQSTQIPETEIIGLNVGGKKFETTAMTLNTLVKGYPDESIKLPHFFSALTNKKCGFKKDENGNVFIDRDPKTIPFILDYLREGGNIQNFVEPKDPVLKQKLIRDTSFYSLTHLNAYLKNKVNVYFDSKILDEKLKKDIIIISVKEKWKLIYRGSRDGFEAKSFHDCCDNISKTLFVVLDSKRNVFGGFKSGCWSSEKNRDTDKGCYLFSLRENNVRCRFVSYASESSGMYIPLGKDFGPSFYQNLFFISDRCNENNKSCRNLKKDKIIFDNSMVVRENFVVKEIEVFQLCFN